MPASLSVIRKFPGWTAASVMLLLGIILILSDRRAASHVGERPWIIHPASEAEHLASIAPWPKSAEDIILPTVKFRFTTDGSQLTDIVDWIGHEVQIKIVVNWRALARANVGQHSPMSFDSTNVRLPVLLAGVRSRSGEFAKLAWTFEPNHTIYITTAQDLAEERFWREQRGKNAGPKLREALDRNLPYVDLLSTPNDAALCDYSRLNGVKIDLQFTPDPRPAVDTRITEENITYERLIEMILQRRDYPSYHGDEGGDEAALRFKVVGDKLVVFRQEARP
jgi:hypothetical protein